MFNALKRHPLPIQAFFDYSLVLTYAFPEAVLAPLLPPGLTLDAHEGNGFLAIALVRTTGLRPAGFPAFMGRDFFLSGYRIFSRFRDKDGKELRGLRILRSDTDKRFMVWSGNLMTHYGYRKCTADETRADGKLTIEIATPGGEADLSVCARIDRAAEAPPPGSPFPDLAIARRFAGPLPHTFGYEPDTRNMVVVKGVRQNWKPMPVVVESARSSFLEKPPFNATAPRLANAFYIEKIPYRWDRGFTVPVPKAAE